MFYSKKKSLEIEDGLVELVHRKAIKKKYTKNKKLKLDFKEGYQKIEFYIFEQEVLKEILHHTKCKNAGNIYDYPDYLPQPDSIAGSTIGADFKMFQRVIYSNKYNAIGLYTLDTWSMKCIFIVNLKSLKKFMKVLKDCVRNDGGANIFRDVNFECKENEYLDIANPIKDDTKVVDVTRGRLKDENLVFDKKSTITKVMGDINNFFKEKTLSMYNKLEIPYKRGVILYGNPGNGKSAMIREIIRTVPDITKIILNPNIGVNITVVLAALTKALNGRKAIVVIEDMDSLITDANRSEFLNILDGVNIKSGLYFIGTTNYIERIDPAFTNRSGRFDKTFEIEDPSKDTRRKFFASRKLDELFADYELENGDYGDADDIVDVFVKYSRKLPMASLKEIITSTAYLLANENDDIKYIKDAVKKAYETIVNNRESHQEAHIQFKHKQQIGGRMPFRNSSFRNGSSRKINFTPSTNNIPLNSYNYAELDYEDDYEDDIVKNKKPLKVVKIKSYKKKKKKEKKNKDIQVKKVKIKRV